MGRAPLARSSLPGGLLAREEEDPVGNSVLIGGDADPDPVECREQLVAILLALQPGVDDFRRIALSRGEVQRELSGAVLSFFQDVEGSLAFPILAFDLAGD